MRLRTATILTPITDLDGYHKNLTDFCTEPGFDEFVDLDDLGDHHRHAMTVPLKAPGFDGLDDLLDLIVDRQSSSNYVLLPLWNLILTILTILTIMTSPTYSLRLLFSSNIESTHRIAQTTSRKNDSL